MNALRLGARAFATTAALALAGVLLAGCPEPPPVPVDVVDGGIDATTDTPDAVTQCTIRGRDESVGMELSIGTGRDGTIDEYRTLAPGDPLWVTPGNQGAQHIVVAFRGRGFSPTLPLVDVRLVRLEDCETVGFLRFRLPFRAAPEDATQLGAEALRVVVLDEDYPEDRLEYCTILGRDAMLLVDFNDGAGHTAHRELRVHIAGIDPASSLREGWERACATGGDGGAPRDSF